MGAGSHLCIEDYLSKKSYGTVFLEVGSDQPPRRHGSTEGLYNIARKFNMNFFTIDTCQKNHDRLRTVLSDFCYNEDFNIITGKGEEKLEEVLLEHGQVGAAYLDNFDWIYDPLLLKEKKEPPEQYQQYLDYKEKGIELNNRNSSIAHLKQTIIIEKYSAPTCIVMYDDTWYDQHSDIFLGKGSSSVIYLLAKGWKLLPVSSRFSHLSHFAIAVGKGIEF